MRITCFFIIAYLNISGIKAQTNDYTGDYLAYSKHLTMVSSPIRCTGNYEGFSNINSNKYSLKE